MSRISIFLCLLIISYSNYSPTGSCFEFNPDDFVLNGTAQLLNDEIVTLTEELNNQGGFLWSQNLVDFTYDFTLEAELNFGTIDSSGADGIAFVIQPLSSDQGSSGGGIGYQGISPSLAIEFDTWFNSNDPTTMDHIALVKNGLTGSLAAHSEFTPFTGVPNLEDGQWHALEIQWNAPEQLLTLVFQGVQIFSIAIDISNLLFSGSTDLFWGFTAATGGAVNLQQVKILEYCSIDSSCDTAPPTADSPQVFCNSTTLDALQIDGELIRFYSDNLGRTPLAPTSEITENTTVFVTQTIDNCESQDLISVDIIIEGAAVNLNLVDVAVCDITTSTNFDLTTLSSYFQTTVSITGCYNSILEAQNKTNEIQNLMGFEIQNDGQIIYLRIETSDCDEIQPLVFTSGNCTVVIPQAFSPNNDQFNDHFNIQNLYGVHLNHVLKIYSRLGVLVFQGDNDQKWMGYSKEGSLVPVGTYFYVLELNNDTNERFTGWVYCNY